MNLQLNGKRALVSGGSRGICEAIALALAREGVDVSLPAWHPEALHATATELSASSGRQVVAVCGDTTSEASVRHAVADAVGHLGGPIDILVNAAVVPAGFAGPPKTGRYQRVADVVASLCSP